MIFENSCAQFRFGFPVNLPAGSVVAVRSGPLPSDPVISSYVWGTGALLTEVGSFVATVLADLDLWTGSPPGTWQGTFFDSGVAALGVVVIFESPQIATTMPWVTPSAPLFTVTVNGTLGPLSLINGNTVFSCDLGEECANGYQKVVIKMSQTEAGNKLFIFPSGLGLDCGDGIFPIPTYVVGPNLYDSAIVMCYMLMRNDPNVKGFYVPPHPDRLLNYESTSGETIVFELYLDVPDCPVAFQACYEDQISKAWGTFSDINIVEEECCGETPCLPCIPYEYLYLVKAI